jgi:hypothetical protein
MSLGFVCGNFVYPRNLRKVLLGDPLTSLPGLRSILGIQLHLSQATVAQRPKVSKIRNS